MTELLECIELNPQGDAQYAVIWLHGLGADGNDFVPIIPELGLDDFAIRFVFPHAPVQPVTINGGMPMRSWYDIFVADLVRQEDAQGIRTSQQHINALIEREIDRGIPSEHIFLAGFSQGSAMTLHTGLRYPKRLAALIGLSGYLPIADQAATERHPANQETPIFMAHGTQDPVVPIQRGQDSHQALEALGYQVQWHTYPMPHAVCPQEIHDISVFMRQVIKAQPAAS